jgi:hypothetical protein
MDKKENKVYSFTFEKELKDTFDKKDINRIKTFLTKLIDKALHLKLLFNEIKETEYEYSYEDLFTFVIEGETYYYTPDFVYLKDTRQILGEKKYKKILDILINDLKLFEYQFTKNGKRYTNKYNSKVNSFKLLPKLLTGFKKQVKINDPKLDKTLKTIFNKTYNNLPVIIKYTYDIVKNYSFSKTLDKRCFSKVINRKYNGYKLKCISNNKPFVEPEKYLKDHLETTWVYIQKWNISNEEELLDFFNNDLDKFGHRFHYILTNIPSELRKYLIKDMISIDIKNSQPFFCACLIYKQTGRKDIDFIKAVESGLFYENLYENSDILKSITDDPKEGRQVAKGSGWCKAAYGQNTDELKESFPEGGAIIDGWKNRYIKGLNIKDLKKYKKYKNAVLLLQRAESSAMNKIWEECLNQNVFFYPLHDAVYFAKKDVIKGRKIVESVLDKLEIKYYLNVD